MIHHNFPDYDCSEMYRDNGWAMRLRRRFAVLRTEPRWVSALRAAVAIARGGR